MNVEITKKQADWLDRRGGRNIEDVEKDESGLFILMATGRNQDEKVYLPKR